ncbi:MAG: DUF4139 domain-containing protein [Bacteroidales bacterium]|nr:DUF4139 domain-containing protein [Bacteroidales bacterium]
MKKFMLILSAVLISRIFFGQDTLKVESKIEAVTVYKEGAQIKRSAEKTIQSGRTVIILEGLTSDLDKNTIKVSANDSVTVVSVMHRFNFLNKDQSNKQINRLNESLESLVDSTDLYKKYLIVLNDEKSLLQVNKKIGGTQTGVDIENLKATSEFYRKRMKEIELEILFNNNKVKAFNKEIIKISRQLNELNVKREYTTSDIVVVLSVKNKLKAEIKFEYFIKKAGWTPYYDIRVTDVNNPVKMIYKAKIYQNSDIDWKNIKLTLSTGDPSVSGFMPVLNPYILTQRNYSYGQRVNYDETFSGYIRGKITDDIGEPLPGVSVLVKGTTTGTMTLENGIFSIQAPYGSKLVFSYIGMETVEQEVIASEMNMCLFPSSEDIGEVVVTALGMSREEKALGYSVQTLTANELNGRTSGVYIRGSSSSRFESKKHSYYDDNFKSDKKNVIPLNMKKNETNREFIINIPYTIRSDNKEYDVTMTEFKLKSEYVHTTIPKLSEKVYLTALITDWQDFGMLNGSANVFFKETYTGKTFLDLGTMTDTLNLSLGVDNDVIVKRDQIKDFTKSRYLGSVRKESRAWKISVKNMKKYPVILIVEDQLPIPGNNKIKVDKIEISNAEENEDSGELKWKLSLKPAETQELLLKYSVKFPNYLRITVD